MSKENKIDLSGYKILGEGEGFKAEIKAKSATKSAIEKMEKAGGKLILSEQKEEEVERINSSIKRARKNKLNKLNVDDATMKLCIRLGIAI